MLLHIFCDSCWPFHLSCSGASRFEFDKSTIFKAMKDKDLPLHRSKNNLYLAYLAPLLPEEDLELWEPFENVGTLRVRDPLFSSSLEIYST